MIYPAHAKRLYVSGAQCNPLFKEGAFLDFRLCVLAAFARDFQLETRAKTQSRQEGGNLTPFRQMVAPKDQKPAFSSGARPPSAISLGCSWISYKICVSITAWRERCYVDPDFGCLVKTIKKMALMIGRLATQ
jgi:hypothetical protein